MTPSVRKKSIVSVAYQYPAPSTTRPSACSHFIAAPGRFPRDVGPDGTADRAGNRIEATSTFDGTDPECGQWSSGSWEGLIGRSQARNSRLGGRCVR
jgi:hypothetical protein